jgi:hypothetical protein
VGLAVQPAAPPDFALAVAPATQYVDLPVSTTYNVTVAPLNGFSSNVNLSVSGLPARAVGVFTPNPATSSSTLTITTGPTVPAGTFKLTITGASGNQVRTAPATLFVRWGYDLRASPTSSLITAGSSTAYTVSVSRFAGFPAGIALSMAGLPPGSTASFAPNPAGASSTVTVVTSANTPPGTYTLSIQGLAGEKMVVRTATVTLVVV